MSDRLLALSGNAAARSVAKTFGVSLPPRLVRDPAPWSDRALADRTVHVLLGPDASLGSALAASLARLGADVGVSFDGRVGPKDGGLAPFTAAAEAWARRATLLEDAGESTQENTARPWAIVLDATGVSDVASLRFLWEALSPRLRGLASSGRIVVLGRPPAAAPTPGARAARNALDGYTRSLARELGRTGATANLVSVPEGTEDRLHGVLHFLLSPRSAYVSGQPWVLSDALPTAFIGARPLDGKIALVTGSARGIGAATARALAREGARVLVHDHPSAKEEVDALASELHGVGLVADLATAEGRTALVQAVSGFGTGRLDVLVQNAGVTRDKTLARMPAEMWDLVLMVNLAAVIDLAERLGPSLADGGAMVCLSSIGGIGGNVGQTNYAATKAGVIGLVEGLAPVLAARGVAVSAVAPGFIETRMTAAVPFATREVARRLSNVSQGGVPEDIAEVVTFLASPSGRALTGRILRVCGGNLLGA
ncbi:MAG: 3-oxoacyl-ACP reductase [Pseudomonadota bacterium]|nr:3-oxoacyl-ACP reductase [Pseudomonadota bacterium]